MKKRLFVYAALAVPVAALLALAAYKAHIYHRGAEIVLPITGYDPRDLLAGHYLTYRVEYGIEGLCESSRTRAGCICFDTDGNRFIDDCAGDPPAVCYPFVRGECRNGRFVAGIERYYIPEAKAASLDSRVRKGGAKIRIAVSPSGRSVVKDLILPE
ncbi:MAG TPA: GDYXXLXY domain-containing protein [Spirochaetota bacterium]|nr:GDYXXLXY domain-containing protein [Spirochaetota bacterium]HNT09512.1 GDYXXLXY domain-containing protein [Spirochaetota bacterium]